MFLTACTIGKGKLTIHLKLRYIMMFKVLLYVYLYVDEMFVKFQ